MKNKVTFIQVKEGKVYASSEVKPVKKKTHCAGKPYCCEGRRCESLQFDDDLEVEIEQFHKTFIEVANKEVLSDIIEDIIYDLKDNPKIYVQKKDGLYPISGMVMEVKEETIYPVIHPKQPKKKVVVISLDPVEERKPFKLKRCSIHGIVRSTNCNECHKINNEKPEPKEIETPPDHLPDVREEMPDSKPDFEEIFDKYCNSYMDMDVILKPDLERIWKEHYLPIREDWIKAVKYVEELQDTEEKLQSELKTLREENEKLKLLCGRFNGT